MDASQPPPTYSFVLVNFNMAGLVLRLVQQLTESLAGDSFEIIIADNSSDAGQKLNAGSFADQPRVRLVSLTENRGFVDALNRILPICRGHWITVLHPDVEITGQSIHALSEFLTAHPTAGVVSPDLVYPNGEGCKIRLRAPAARTELRRLGNVLTYIAFKQKFLADEVVWDRSSDTIAETVMSVCMMFRRTALDAAGPVDPGLKFYYANDYLCHCIRQLGLDCHYVKGARAIHFERYTPRQMYSTSEVMRYKSSTVASNPRMRQDYFQYLRLCYPLWKRIILRGVALAEDMLQLAGHIKRLRSGKSERSLLWKSIRIDLGSNS
jgi:GT2 family glycosyltransferase